MSIQGLLLPQPLVTRITDYAATSEMTVDAFVVDTLDRYARLADPAGVMVSPPVGGTQRRIDIDLGDDLAARLAGLHPQLARAQIVERALYHYFDCLDRNGVWQITLALPPATHHKILRIAAAQRCSADLLLARALADYVHTDAPWCIPNRLLMLPSTLDRALCTASLECLLPQTALQDIEEMQNKHQPETGRDDVEMIWLRAVHYYINALDDPGPTAALVLHQPSGKSRARSGKLRL